MPDYKIELHPGAIAEAESAQAWYAERSKTASKAFVAELTHAVNKISESPLRWPEYHKETRRYFFPRFPFSLVYRVKEGLIEVIAIILETSVDRKRRH